MKYKYKKIVTEGANGTTITHRQNKDENIKLLGHIGEFTYIYSPTALINQHEALVFEEVVLTEDKTILIRAQRYYKSAESALNQTIQGLVSGYPLVERETFDLQDREVEKYVIDSSVATPYIDGLVASKGVDKAELVAKIASNSLTLKVATAKLIGAFNKVWN